MPPIEPFPERVKRLARSQHMSAAAVAHEAWDRKIPGTSVATFNKAMRGKRHPGRKLIEQLAAVLEVDPWEFPEYRLASYRAALDEREVGLDAAIANIGKLTKRRAHVLLMDTLEQELETFALQESERDAAAAASSHGRRRGDQAS